MIACEDDHLCAACRESVRVAATWDFRRDWWRIAFRLAGVVVIGVWLVVIGLLVLFSPLFALFS